MVDGCPPRSLMGLPRALGPLERDAQSPYNPGKGEPGLERCFPSRRSLRDLARAARRHRLVGGRLDVVLLLRCLVMLRLVAMHLIADTYATHKHPKVKSWLKRHPRFHMHFTPTSASWLNMVERFFRDLSHNAIERGVFPNVAELISTIQAYVEDHNRNPKPFIWTARALDFLAKVAKARARLNKLQSV